MHGVARNATPFLAAVAAIATALSAASHRWLPTDRLPPASKLAADFEPEAWLNALWLWLYRLADWLAHADLGAPMGA